MGRDARSTSLTFDDFEHAAIGAVLVDADGRIARVNRRFCAMLGVDEATLVGRTWSEITHDQDRDVCASAIARARALGPAGTRVRKRYVLGDHVVHADVAITPLTSSPGSLLALVVDAGEEVALHRELERHRRKLAIALELAADGTWEWDIPAGRIEVSRSWRTLFGIPDDEPVDIALWQSLLHPDDAARIHATFAPLMAGELDEFENEFRVCAPAGELWLHDRGRVLEQNPDGTPRLLQGTVRDISRQKRAEAELAHGQRMESLGRLAAGVAHDFNNLLTTVLGNATLLRMSLSEDHPDAPLLDQIAQAVDTGSQLTRQLLTFSRRTVAAPQALAASSVVQEMQPLLERTAGENITLTTELAPPAQTLILFDPTQLRQVIFNLVVNARDAMPDGGRVVVSVAGEDDRVVLGVRDDGPGIADGIRDRLFEPFFTTRGHAGGTGLGLSIVYGAVHQAGGHIDVESTPGRGTVFFVRVPRAPHCPDALASDAPSAPRWVRGQGHLCVLDDTAPVRQTVARVLRGLGYTVDEHATGRELLDAVTRGARYDVLVSDVILPGLRGPDVVHRVRASLPGVRVLFISGHVDVELRLDEHTLFLAKPFTPGQLAEHVKTLLGSS